jgi:hypothetical protein
VLTNFPFALERWCGSEGAKIAFGGRNDDQRPIDKLVSGRYDKNPVNSICASTYYSEKEPKHVAVFLGRDIFL